MNLSDLDGFTRGYIECALWSSTDENHTPLDSLYSVADLTPEALGEMVADCERFQHENANDLAAASVQYDNIPNAIDGLAHAGHDFWLTRNRHGAGFWDGDLPKELGERLSAAAEAFGECYLYGDDGKVYCE